MKVKVLRSFIDLSENMERKQGETFECSEARFNEIKAKLPEWVEGVEEVKPAPAKTPKAKTTSKKQGK